MSHLFNRGTVPTVRIKHVDLPDGMLINTSDFDPKAHELFDPAAGPTKEARQAELDVMGAGAVAEIAASHGIEHKNKPASIVAILATEYPEQATA